jgi:hypothetical protein
MNRQLFGPVPDGSDAPGDKEGRECKPAFGMQTALPSSEHTEHSQQARITRTKQAKYIEKPNAPNHFMKHLFTIL